MKTSNLRKWSLGSLLAGVFALLSAAALIPLCLPGWAQAPGQPPAPQTSSNVAIEISPQLFATMCALYAAGFEAEVSSVGVPRAAARLRGDMFRMQGPAAEALRKFYREHWLQDRAALLSRYVSFALVAGAPPEFKLTLRRAELPPDVLEIEGFSEVLANFYREAQIDRFWAQVEPEYNRAIARLSGAVGQLVLTSAAYLRELVKPGGLRAFTVYVEPLVGGRTNFRSYAERYAVVVGAGEGLPLDEIRHAFLHFLLDPLAIRHASLVTTNKPLLDLAAHAPRLPADYREDLPAFFTECLVRAVELRVRRLPPEKLATAVDRAESEGYVLVRALVRELERFEKVEPAMTHYFADLVRAIDTTAEVKRLQSIVFAPASPPEPWAGSAAETAEDDSDVRAWLVEGEHQIAAKQPEAAIAAFQRVLEGHPEHSRALYGLGVAAVLQGDARRAKGLFQRLVAQPSTEAPASARDPLILAWSHVYLGRIYDVDGNRELAISEYRAALAVEGAPESARLAAQRGLEKGYDTSSRQNPPC